MYHECISCPKIGVSCDGPNFVAMPAPELLAWCKARKAHLGLSNGKLAEMSNMSKGTIDRLFAGEHIDFKHETIRPLIRVLVGGEWNGNPCPDPQENDNTELKEKAERLARNNKLLQEHIDRDNEQHQQQLQFLRDQIKHEQRATEAYKRTAAILGSLLGLAVTVIVAALVVDWLNSGVGFFWIDKTLSLFTGGE